VSTDGQSVEAQVAELTAAGASQVFSESASGARSDRAQLKRAVAALVEATCFSSPVSIASRARRAIC
jgi:hypothetical protein